MHGIYATGAHSHCYDPNFWWYWLGAAIITLPINIYMHVRDEDMTMREAIVPSLMLSVFFGLGEIIVLVLAIPFLLLCKLTD